MLKPRLVGVILIKEGIVVQSVNFKKYLPVGSPEIAIEYLNEWGIDEIVLLDIDARMRDHNKILKKISDYSKFCQVPIAVGGGINNLDQIKGLVQSGADKIVLNTSAFNNLKLISESANLFGSQCIVVSIDVKKNLNGGYEVYINSGKQPTGIDIIEYSIDAQKHGAGELLINSIDRDGTKVGYDLNLIKKVYNNVEIPIVICGGVGNAKHLFEGISLGVSGVAAANFFHFTEHSVILAKQYLRINGCKIRLDTVSKYEERNFDDDCRADKVNDDVLNKLRFEYIPEEKI